MKEITIIPATIDNRIFGNKKQTLRVASYSRVSTNFEEQLTSFETQKTCYTNLILKTKGWSLAGTYADEGISGVTENRPGFQKLMRHCRKGKVDLVVTKSISRFSRNIVITLNRIRELKSLGIGVYFEKENINTLEENSEFVISILAGIAQEESHSLSLNVRKGKQMAMQNGVVYWNYNNTFGYRKGENNEPEIIEEDAKIIRQIYKLYLSGESDSKIAKILNNGNVKTPKGKDVWKTASIQKILQYERYCGDVILQKTYIENHITKKAKINNGEFPKVHIKNNHDAIIPKEIYNQAITERARRNSKRSTSKMAKSEKGKFSSKYALNDILVCGDCLSPMQRAIWSKKKKKGQLVAEKRPVWRCSKRIKYGLKYCKDAITLDEYKIHNAIVEAINATESSRDNVIEFTKRELSITLSEKINSEFDLNKTQKKIEEIKNEVLQIVSSGKAADNLELIKEMNAEAMKLNDLVREYNETQSSKAIASQISEIEEYLVKKSSNDEYDDKLARQIIDIIKVIDETKVMIVFKDGVEYEQSLEE